METAGVSIVIPVRDGGDTLAGTVGSALLQDGVDVDVVIVDDGSTDETSTVAAVLAFDPRVAVVTNTTGAGTARTLAQGAALARHRWTAFLPAGSHLRPDACRKALDAAGRDGARVVRSAGEGPGGPLGGRDELSIAGTFASTDLAVEALAAVPPTVDGDGSLSLLALCLASGGVTDCPDLLADKTPAPDGDEPATGFADACRRAADVLAGASRVISRMDGWDEHRDDYVALAEALLAPLLEAAAAGPADGCAARRFKALVDAVPLPEVAAVAAGLPRESLDALAGAVACSARTSVRAPAHVARALVVCPPGLEEEAASIAGALGDLAVETVVANGRQVPPTGPNGGYLPRARALQRLLTEGGFDAVAVASSPDRQTLVDAMVALACGTATMVAVPHRDRRLEDDGALAGLVSLATVAGTADPGDAAAWSKATGRLVEATGAGCAQERWSVLLDAVEAAAFPVPPRAAGPLLALFDPRLNDAGPGSLPCSADERVALLEAQVASLEARLAAARDEARALREQLAGAGPLRGERTVPDFPPGDPS